MVSLTSGGNGTAVQALRQDIARLLRLLQLNHDAVVGLDEAFHILFINQGAEHIFGYAPAEVVGRTIHALLPDGLDATARARSGDYSVPRWPAGGENPLWHLTGRRKSGETLTLETSISEFRYGGERTIVLVLRDATERLEGERQLRFLADHDALTRLPNRRHFLDRLDGALARARRHGWRMALAYVDLNGLKPVNDTLGHAAGDLLLQTVADRLRATVRHSDTVARIGGDEFTAILEEVHGDQDALGVAQKMMRELVQPMALQTRKVRIHAGIGLALFPDHGAAPATLLKQAEQAMYAAKRSGQPQIYRPEPLIPPAS